MRGEVDEGAAAGLGAVDAPVRLAGAGGPVAAEPAGVDDAHRRHRAEPARRDRGADCPVGRVMALVEGGAVEDAARPHGLGHGLGVREEGGHRLLAEDRLARRRQRLDRLPVEMVGARDVDRLHLGIGDEPGDAGVGTGALALGGGAGVRARVAHRDEPVPGGADARRHVVAGDPAVADDAPADRVGHGLPHHQRSGRSTNSRVRTRVTASASDGPIQSSLSGPGDRRG